MASENTSRSLAELDSLRNTALVLLQQLEDTLLSIRTQGGQELSKSSQRDLDPTLDVLALAHDSATLIKAHSSKISLFIINEPFTPTAISKVLRELVSGPIPALSSAAQSCDARRYTALVQRHLALGCYTILKELRELVQRIPQNGKILQDEQKHGSVDTGQKGSIVATGTLWAACDGVIDFTKSGVEKYLVQRMQSFNGTLKDIMEELKEWSEETADSDSEPEGLTKSERTATDYESSHASTQDMLDDFMSSHKTIPTQDTLGIRDRLAVCVKRLRLTTLLYQAIIKRRLRSMPPLPASEPSSMPQRLDEAFAVLRRIPEKYGDVAAAFYDLDVERIDTLVEECVLDASKAAELMSKPMTGKPDEFTAWAEKFHLQIRKD